MVPTQGHHGWAFFLPFQFDEPELTLYGSQAADHIAAHIFLLFSRHCTGPNSSYALSRLSLTTRLSLPLIFYSHFTNEEAKAWRSKEMCPRLNK